MVNTKESIFDCRHWLIKFWTNPILSCKLNKAQKKNKSKLFSSECLPLLRNVANKAMTDKLTRLCMQSSHHLTGKKEFHAVTSCGCLRAQPAATPCLAFSLRRAEILPDQNLFICCFPALSIFPTASCPLISRALIRLFTH